MLLDEINKANVVAFKEKNAVIKDIISVIKSRAKLLEVEKRTKNEALSDADIVNLIQKLIKELAEARENYVKVNNDCEVKNIDEQIEFCNSFLPNMLSKDEIKNIILFLDDKSIPAVMKHFKTNYAGAVDMRDVQEVLKSI
ncbi:MAG: GatB/YqeY domain-containing protein [Clostridia bacterium]|nr:GatB/YqeY domain-containing protein [Clostridia bacterium]